MKIARGQSHGGGFLLVKIRAEQKGPGYRSSQKAGVQTRNWWSGEQTYFRRLRTEGGS